MSIQEAIEKLRKVERVATMPTPARKDFHEALALLEQAELEPFRYMEPMKAHPDLPETIDNCAERARAEQAEPDLSAKVDLSAGAEPGEFTQRWKGFKPEHVDCMEHKCEIAYGLREACDLIHRLNAEKKAIQEIAIGKMQAALDYPDAAIDILHIGITELKKEGKPTPEDILRRGGLLNKLITENEKLKNGCHELLLKQDELRSEKEAQAERIAQLKSENAKLKEAQR